MLGLMQNKPLLISSLIEHAAAFHSEQEIVSRFVEDDLDGPLRRSTYGELHRRAKQAANVLRELGVEPGDRVGTLAWNTTRHFELYFAVSGSGAVLHTINPRLFPEQVDYIVNHAEDKVLMFDISFAALVEELAPSLSGVEHFVALTDRAHLPAIDVPGGVLCYEDLMAAQSDDFAWPTLDENSASSLCYTSGTTGNPKGVLYSHRSTVLHTLMCVAPDVCALSARSTVLLMVPMFHANAWGVPYAAAMVGAKLVLPADNLDGHYVARLMREEKVTFSQAVPTVWMMFFQYLDAHPEVVPELSLTDVGVGGSAPSRALIRRLEDELGVDVAQAWGMTETSPLATFNRALAGHDDLSREAHLDVKAKSGRAVWGVEFRITDDQGRAVPFDGTSRGNLSVRGPWIASGYYRADGESVLDEDGYLPTGDIAVMDEEGYLKLVDRSKDVIKSGGEWISSVDLENAAYQCPGVAEAAVVGIAHPKWQERPLMVVVKQAGAALDADQLRDHLARHVASWWLPDDVVFVDELPHTATGKILKAKLREQFRDHRSAHTG